MNEPDKFPELLANIAAEQQHRRRAKLKNAAERRRSLARDPDDPTPHNREPGQGEHVVNVRADVRSRRGKTTEPTLPVVEQRSRLIVAIDPRVAPRTTDVGLEAHGLATKRKRVRRARLLRLTELAIEFSATDVLLLDISVDRLSHDAHCMLRVRCEKRRKKRHERAGTVLK